jgi:uncharacterized CHY-type Zn-finger protein
MKECDVCGFKGKTTYDEYLHQRICESCDNGFETVFCAACNKLVLEDNLEWLNNCPLCECGSIIKI